MKKKYSNCKVCGSRSELFDVVDFNKVCFKKSFYQNGLSGTPVFYYRCIFCNFIYTEFCDHWSKSKFIQEIYNSFYNLVDPAYIEKRPTNNGRLFAKNLTGYNPRILDFGSGNGKFCNILCESGYTNIVSYDPFVIGSKPVGKFDLITAFEVFEHIVNPSRLIQTLSRYLSEDGCIVFTTLLQPLDIEDIRGAWWYIAPRNGHISIYSLMSLLKLSERFQYRYLSSNDYHCFSKSPHLPTFLDSFQFQESRIVIVSACNGSSEDLYGYETAGAYQFRWSRKSIVNWEIGVDFNNEAKINIIIPFLFVINDSFLSDIYAEVNGIKTQIIVSQGRPSTLHAHILLQPCKVLKIKLFTADPVRPCDFKPTEDSRHLGIAICDMPKS